MWTLKRAAYARVGLGWFIEAEENDAGDGTWDLYCRKDVPEGGYFGCVVFNKDGTIDALDVGEEDRTPGYKTTMEHYLDGLEVGELREALVSLGQEIGEADG